MKRINAANCLTSLRIIGAAVMAFLPPLSLRFLLVYLVAGASDVLDGHVARATGTAGDAGARFDSIADLIFYSVMLVCFFPYLRAILPRVIWIWVALIITVRIADYIVTAVKFRSFSSPHSIPNKITGFLMFGVPLAIHFTFFTLYVTVLCSVATYGSTKDLSYHVKKYVPKEKKETAADETVC